MEAELIRSGLRLRDLGTERLTLRDVFVLCMTPAPGSRLGAVIDPALAWPTEAELLAIMVDQLGILMHGLGGGKGRKPEPLDRPWGKPGHENSVEKKRGQTFTSDDEARAWADRFRPKKH